MGKLRTCSYCLTLVDHPCLAKDHLRCNFFLSRRAACAASPEFAAAGGGRKDDTGKLPLDLLAPEYLLLTAAVLQFGANKYEAYNWAKGMKWSRVFAALMRHMWAWWAGERNDPETNISHLGHASCCLMFLIAYEQRGTGEDDRPKV